MEDDGYACRNGYYLPSNGLTERSNHTLISLIRKYTQQHPNHWAEFLPLFEFAYNSAAHSVIKMLPFEAERGYVPPTPATLLTTEWNHNVASATQVKERVDALKKAWSRISTLIKNHEDVQR